MIKHNPLPLPSLCDERLLQIAVIGQNIGFNRYR